MHCNDDDGDDDDADISFISTIIGSEWGSGSGSGK